MNTKKNKSFIFLLIEAFKETVRDQFQNFAGGLAYYLFLSIAPLIGFSIFLSDKILGHAHTMGKVIPFLKSYFPPQFVNLIVFFLHRNSHIESNGLLSLSVLAALALAYSTKEYFGMVKDTVELTWNKRGDRFGIIYFFKRLLEDIVIAVVALSIISFFIFFGTILPHQNYANVPVLLISYLSAFALEYSLFFTLFFFCFFLLSPVKVYWKNALVPAVVGAMLQTIGREVMKIVTMTPDAELAESFLVVLFWFYYSSIVFIYSAEFAKVYISEKQHIDYKNLNFDR
jgi:membrane protein